MTRPPPPFEAVPAASPRLADGSSCLSFPILRLPREATSLGSILRLMLDIRFSPPAAASLEGAPPSEPSSPSPAAGEAEEEAEDDEAAAEPLPSSPPRRPAAAVSGGGLVPALAEPSPPSAWRGRTNTTASKQTRQTWSVTKQEPWNGRKGDAGRVKGNMLLQRTVVRCPVGQGASILWKKM